MFVYLPSVLVTQAKDTHRRHPPPLFACSLYGYQGRSQWLALQNVTALRYLVAMLSVQSLGPSRFLTVAHDEVVGSTSQLYKLSVFDFPGRGQDRHRNGLIGDHSTSTGKGTDRMTCR